MKLALAWLLIVLPLRHLEVTSPFGYRVHPITGKYRMHAGVDLRAKRDTVFAIMDGIISRVSYEPEIGIYIRIDHPIIQSLYGHLSTVFVAPGEQVKAGDPIAITGATGRVTGEHLHLAIRYQGRYIDPIKFLYELLKQQEHE